MLNLTPALAERGAPTNDHGGNCAGNEADDNDFWEVTMRKCLANWLKLISQILTPWAGLMSEGMVPLRPSIAMPLVHMM